MRRLIPLLLLLTACASDPPPGAQERRAKLDEEFTLARGESIGLAGTPYVVVFDQVLEDSRCAQGMTCIWEGNARVGLHLVDGDVAFKFELNTSPRIPTRDNGSSVAVELRRLEPLPKAGAQTEAYSVTLVARKR